VARMGAASCAVSKRRPLQADVLSTSKK
jgi:hypothetical protein